MFYLIFCISDESENKGIQIPIDMKKISFLSDYQFSYRNKIVLKLTFDGE